jgi:polysaccharide export outer membrane protein
MGKYLLILFLLLPAITYAQNIETETRFSPGDVIEIRYFYTPELNVIQTIRPDGKIFLQLIGEVDAKDKTATWLQREIQRRYRPYMQEIDIAIIVQSLSERYIYVGGLVNTPGIIVMERQRPFTALEAVMKAGGINTELASYENVVIIRHENGKWKHIKLDLENVLLGTNDNPTYLQHLDILYVPQRLIYKKSDTSRQ